MWRKCVKFTDQSKPIKFSKSGDHKSISIVFGTDSLGTLLNFQRVKGEVKHNILIHFYEFKMNVLNWIIIESFIQSMHWISFFFFFDKE